jgi:hypothetical protein
MNQKFTAEEVRAEADFLSTYSRKPSQMLTAYADSIERAQAGVTDAVVDRVCAAFALIKPIYPPVFEGVRAALLAVWPNPPAQAAQVDGFDMLAHLQRQREWSGRTFGPGTRAQGVVDHIRKELREIEADPGDLNEWIDVVILALDGAWRSGAKPEEIIAALAAKQTKNEGRVWPDWRTADPNKAIEHDRSHDAHTAEPMAQTADSGRVPEGTWLWCKLMDWCKARRVPPAEYSDLFAIAGEAHKLNASPDPSSPEGEPHE